MQDLKDKSFSVKTLFNSFVRKKSKTPKNGELAAAVSAAVDAAAPGSANTSSGQSEVAASAGSSLPQKPGSQVVDRDDSVMEDAQPAGNAQGATAGYAQAQAPASPARPQPTSAATPALNTAAAPAAPSMPSAAAATAGLSKTAQQHLLREQQLAAARGPRGRDSLRYRLKLQQYNFNDDLNVEDARHSMLDELEELPEHTAVTQGAMSGGGASSVQSGIGLLAVSPALPPKMRRWRWCADDYELLKHLHKGYASNVYAARCKLSGEQVAVKVYKLSDQEDIPRMQLFREVTIHSKLQHKNVVQFYAAFMEANHVFIVQEFAGGGDLLHFVHRCAGRLQERQAVGMVLQPFLTALHYLHTQGIVHRDIKPDNVLLTTDKVLKLADFGLAISIKQERPNTRAGTLDYMAPEVLFCATKATPDEHKRDPESNYYSAGADAWAVGVFAYELVVGVSPFRAKEKADTARNIIHANVEFPQRTSELAKDFIMSCLEKHPGDRPTVVEMLQHPWMTVHQRRTSASRYSAATINEPVADVMKAQQNMDDTLVG